MSSVSQRFPFDCPTANPVGPRSHAKSHIGLTQLLDFLSGSSGGSRVGDSTAAPSTAERCSDLANSFKDLIAPTPTLDVYEVENGSLILNADLPGVSEDEIAIDVNRDTITISGTRTIQRPEIVSRSCFLYERTHGAFSRTVQLPFAPNPESITATYKDGVLTIAIPNESKPAGRVKIVRSNN